MTRRQLIREAKAEIEAWHSLPRGIVLAILWAYVYRITEGEPIDNFLNQCKSHAPDYEI